jgi:hypothetical protein
LMLKRFPLALSKASYDILKIITWVRASFLQM